MTDMKKSVSINQNSLESLPSKRAKRPNRINPWASNTVYCKTKQDQIEKGRSFMEELNKSNKLVRDAYYLNIVPNKHDASTATQVRRNSRIRTAQLMPTRQVINTDVKNQTIYLENIVQAANMTREQSDENSPRHLKSLYMT